MKIQIKVLKEEEEIVTILYILTMVILKIRARKIRVRINRVRKMRAHKIRVRINRAQPNSRLYDLIVQIIFNLRQNKFSSH